MYRGIEQEDRCRGCYKIASLRQKRKLQKDEFSLLEVGRLKPFYRPEPYEE